MPGVGGLWVYKFTSCLLLQGHWSITWLIVLLLFTRLLPAVELRLVFTQSFKAATHPCSENRPSPSKLQQSGYYPVSPDHLLASISIQVLLPLGLMFYSLTQECGSPNSWLKKPDNISCPLQFLFSMTSIPNQKNTGNTHTPLAVCLASLKNLRYCSAKQLFLKIKEIHLQGRVGQKMALQQSRIAGFQPPQTATSIPFVRGIVRWK